MHADEAGGYNTLSAMKDMGRNMTSGAPAQRWLTLMPLIDGKMKTGQRSETHTIFSSGEECKSAPRTYDIMTHIPGAGTATTGRRHNHPRRRHNHRRLHCCLWHRNNSPMSDARTSASRHVIHPMNL